MICDPNATGYYQKNGVTKEYPLDDTCFLVSVAGDRRVVLTTNQASLALGKPRQKGFEIEGEFNRLRRKFGV